MTAKIPLQNGEYAIVDKEDYERCMEHVWYVEMLRNKHLIARSNSANSRNLAAFIMNNKDKNKFVFKRNYENGLDFTKKNLYVSEKVNSATVGRGRKGTSKYKGVYWDRRLNKWRVSFMHKGKENYVGAFDNEDEAAVAYNSSVKQIVGDKAYMNIIGSDNTAYEVDYNYVKQTRRINKNKYKGISKRGNKYASQISYKSKKHYLGLYCTPEQAAKAYDKKAYELYGDKAILNFPEQIEEYKKVGEISV